MFQEKEIKLLNSQTLIDINSKIGDIRKDFGKEILSKDWGKFITYVESLGFKDMDKDGVMQDEFYFSYSSMLEFANKLYNEAVKDDLAVKIDTGIINFNYIFPTEQKKLEDIKYILEKIHDSKDQLRNSFIRRFEAFILNLLPNEVPIIKTLVNNLGIEILASIIVNIFDNKNKNFKDAGFLSKAIKVAGFPGKPFYNGLIALPGKLYRKIKPKIDNTIEIDGERISIDPKHRLTIEKIISLYAELEEKEAELGTKKSELKTKNGNLTQNESKKAAGSSGRFGLKKTPDAKGTIPIIKFLNTEITALNIEITALNNEITTLNNEILRQIKSITTATAIPRTIKDFKYFYKKLKP